MTTTGSASDGRCGVIYYNETDHDYDVLLTGRYIKLYTPRTNNINNPPLLLLRYNQKYDVSFLSKKMTAFHYILNYHWRK